ncbi:MAG: hypothetical protein ACI9QD_000477 [Thermoproteota archaeon]|jgi:hypothetical protein
MNIDAIISTSLNARGKLAKPYYSFISKLVSSISGASILSNITRHQRTIVGGSFLSVLILLANFYTSNTQSNYKVDKLIPLVSLEHKSTIPKELNKLETFYLEDVLDNRRLSLEVLTHSNLKSDADFYYFDNVKKGFQPKSLKQLKVISKVTMEQKLLASIPKSFRNPDVLPIIKVVLAVAQKHKVDPFWALSVMWTESHFKYKAKSHVGASGLMQIMPQTKLFLLKVVKAKRLRLEALGGWNHLSHYNPEIKTWKEYKRFKGMVLNIELGIFYLKHLLNYFRDNHLYATVAYNMGPGWTIRRLRRKKPVGNKNIYVNKVRKAYHYMLKHYPKHKIPKDKVFL